MNQEFDIRLVYTHGQITLVINQINQEGITTQHERSISVIEDGIKTWVTPVPFKKGSLRFSDLWCVKRDNTKICPQIDSSWRGVILALKRFLPIRCNVEDRNLSRNGIFSNEKVKIPINRQNTKFKHK